MTLLSKKNKTKKEKVPTFREIAQQQSVLIDKLIGMLQETQAKLDLLKTTLGVVQKEKEQDDSQ